MNAQEIQARLKAQFGDAVGELSEAKIDPFVTVKAEKIVELFSADDPKHVEAAQRIDRHQTLWHGSWRRGGRDHDKEGRGFVIFECAQRTLVRVGEQLFVGSFSQEANHDRGIRVRALNRPRRYPHQAKVKGWSCKSRATRELKTQQKVLWFQLT